MRRALLLCLGMAAVTWLEFTVFPGHSYLQSDTQLYLPVLERLNTPGYLTRDLAATNFNLSYTIYDEVTLLLHNAARVPFRNALIAQQLVFRIAALVGIFLLARATGLNDLFAFLLAALVNLGAVLPGPAACLADPEPVPRAFAFGLSLLAMGLLARGKALLSGFAGGLALLYDPLTAAPFWCVLFAGFLSDRAFRLQLRPTLPIFIVFILLLANLAQLQPGVSIAEPPFAKVSANAANLQIYRTPYIWVTAWGREIWSYLAIFVFGLWAAARIVNVLNRSMRWLIVGTALAGVLSIPLSYLLLERLRFEFVGALQPAKLLVYTVAVSALLFGLAGMRAIRQQNRWEAFGWFVLLLALPFNARVFDFLHPITLLYAALAVGLTWILARFALTPWRSMALIVPLLAAIALAKTNAPAPAMPDLQAVHELADWAGRSTWGSSVFLFPDAGRELYPGIFRAESRRALWVDWKTGAVVAFSEPAALEWWKRWQTTMAGGFSPVTLERTLPLPIDYYVLKRRNQLSGARPAFTNREFAVYDAQDLRNASQPLRLAK